MATDLRLVAHAAQRDAHELAPHRTRDGFTETGLADAGRADQREHGSRLARLAVGRLDVASDSQLANGEELDDAVLHLVEAVVIGIEHGSRLIEVELIVGARVPRQFEDAIEPRTDP